MYIGKIKIGYQEQPFMVAEIGINHNGDINLAKQLIDGAAEAGCAAVKFQKRTVEKVYSSEELERPRENLFGSTNGDLKRGLEFGRAEYDEIDRYCKAKGIMWYASPWDEASVDFLEQYDLPCYKIASPSATDKDLIEYIKSKGKPIIVSTGMMDDSLVERVVDILGEENLVIMHCTSTYPAKTSELHLLNVPRMIRKYPGAYIGYSGHEVGAYPSLIAAAYGACVIERHITLDRAMWGSDHAASLELGGLSRLMAELKELRNYMGQADKVILESERPIIEKLRRKHTI